MEVGLLPISPIPLITIDPVHVLLLIKVQRDVAFRDKVLGVQLYAIIRAFK